jgi:hypothetical protein
MSVSQVEAFFLEALDQVKRDIQHRNASTKRATQSLKALSGSSRFPAIRDSGSPTAAAPEDNGKVELKDLTLEVWMS